MEFKKAFYTWLGGSWLPKPIKKKPDNPEESSIFALMEDGSMKNNSLSRIIYEKLMEAFNNKYKDNPDREALLSAITANYHLEVETAWTAFLAEIGDYGD